jgi:hypothetical protein
MKNSYFKAIDKLRVKFDNDKPLTLKEACWILWAERHVCSHQYLAFAAWCKQNKFSRKTKWNFYSALFDVFLETEYSQNWKHKFYSELKSLAA